MHFETERAQTLDHYLRVFAPERAAQSGDPFTQCRQDERAICDALGAGHGDLGLHRLLERDDFDEFR